MENLFRAQEDHVTSSGLKLIYSNSSNKINTLERSCDKIN